MDKKNCLSNSECKTQNVFVTSFTIKHIGGLFPSQALP
jgi:hypothetical protein